MEISVEISYYPLTREYNEIIEEFLFRLNEVESISVTTSEMSTILKGNYDIVIDILKILLKPFLEKYPSVFTLKIANACGGDCTF